MFHSVLLGVQIRGGESKSASGFGPGGGGPYPLADLDRGSKSAGGPNPLWRRVNPSLAIVCARLLIQYGAGNCKKVHCSISASFVIYFQRDSYCGEYFLTAAAEVLFWGVMCSIKYDG